MKAKIAPLVIAVIITFVVSIRSINAQEPDYLPPGYAREMNEWLQVCDPDDLSPLSSDFEPDENSTVLFSYPLDHDGAFGKIEDAGAVSSDNPFLALLFNYNGEEPVFAPSVYLQEAPLVNYYDGQPQCFWNVYVTPRLLPGLHTAQTPRKEFSNPVEHADVAFMYYYSDRSIARLFQWRPYRVMVHWSDGLDTQVGGYIDGFVDSGERSAPTIGCDTCPDAIVGFIEASILPRQGKTITSIWLEFDAPSLSTDIPYSEVLPVPELFVDAIAIRGFYRVNAPTPTPTRTPIPRTPTATPTARPSLWATPSPIASPTGTITPLATKLLPSRYSYPPTSIPALNFPAWPAVPTLAPIATPAPLVASIPTALALFTPAPIGALPPTPLWNNPTPPPTPDTWADDIISYTNWLSAEVSAMQATQTLTISTAPDWYAPNLPREIADIGWTFEQAGEDTTARYSLDTWASLFGSMVAMPIRLAKGVQQLFQFMGPIGYFFTWLLVMLPAVLFIKWLQFIKATFIRIFNFLLSVVDWILKLWNAIPWYFGGPG